MSYVLYSDMARPIPFHLALDADEPVFCLDIFDGKEHDVARTDRAHVGSILVIDGIGRFIGRPLHPFAQCIAIHVRIERAENVNAQMIRIRPMHHASFILQRFSARHQRDIRGKEYLVFVL